MHLPPAQGLYDPRHEHDACGVGFVANLKGRKSHEMVAQALQILVNLDHRGAVGADPLAGDGAGILIQIPDAYFRAEMAAIAAQRNAKIVGIFARLFRRDGKPRYLGYLPRVWGNLNHDLAHPSLASLRAWYDRTIPSEKRL